MNLEVPEDADCSPFAEIDISNWTPDGFEPLGTKPKMWLIEPITEQMWLFKEATSNSRADGSAYRKGDDWAERIATAVAVELGLPVADTELALVDRGDDVAYGTVSKKVLSDAETLIHGNELLADIGVAATSTRDRTGYTLNAVQAALEYTAPPSGREHMTAWEWFVGYLVLDALIGNTDRHQENWAVIENGGRRLAPTFDHASCLGFLLDDVARESHLTTNDQNQQVSAYAGRARSKFEGSAHPCDIAHLGLDMVQPSVRAHWLERVAGLSSLRSIIEQVPAHRMSDVARDFAAQVYDTNRARTL